MSKSINNTSSFSTRLFNQQEQPTEVFCKLPFAMHVAIMESLLKKRLWHRCFSCESCEISKNTFFTEHLWWSASKSNFPNIKLSQKFALTNASDVSVLSQIKRCSEWTGGNSCKSPQKKIGFPSIGIFFEGLKTLRKFGWRVSSTWKYALKWKRNFDFKSS